MAHLYTALKALVLPPLNFFALVAVGWLLSLRWPRLGRGLIFIAILLLYGLATPYLSSELARGLQAYSALTGARLDPQAKVIIILSADLYDKAPEYGGDTVGRLTLERLRYGVHLFRKLHLPLLVTGGQPHYASKAVATAMKETLERDFQVPVRWVEPASHNTYENAAFSAQLLQTADIHKAYLVTHALHMPRAKAAFEAFGIAIIPAPTHFVNKPTPELDDFFPTAWALNLSTYALYEWIGRLWYTLVLF